MRNVNQPLSIEALFRAIMEQIELSYGSLKNPRYWSIYENIKSKPYLETIAEIKSHAIDATEYNDWNDDVALRLSLQKAEDNATLLLSGVGPYAILYYQVSDGKFLWVERSVDAPTPLCKVVASVVEQHGFTLLSRTLVERTIPMKMVNDDNDATLFQALFTDSDVIP